MITLYTKPGCPGCRMSKRFFDSHGISYTTVDVLADPSALEHVKQLGHVALPVVETPFGHWSGYNPDKLASLVAA